jgi:hypothetical protein
MFDSSSFAARTYLLKTIFSSQKLLEAFSTTNIRSKQAARNPTLPIMSPRLSELYVVPAQFLAKFERYIIPRLKRNR